MAHSTIDTTKLKTLIQSRWSRKPGDKALSYIGKFFDSTCMGAKIVAKTAGNHGTYTVSVEINDKTLESACSCYIGKSGYCHHCEALALTYLQDPTSFREVELPKREDVKGVSDLPPYLQSVTLDSLLKQLSAKGITQKAFAEIISMNPRHLSAIKSSEARNHYFNELGATKLACHWVLEHVAEYQGR